jgi:hypothetical protein
LEAKAEFLVEGNGFLSGIVVPDLANPPTVAFELVVVIGRLIAEDDVEFDDTAGLLLRKLVLFLIVDAVVFFSGLFRAVVCYFFNVDIVDSFLPTGVFEVD